MSTIAETILEQINHADAWARARWGCRQLVDQGSALKLVCGRGLRVVVQYDEGPDTYTVATYRVRAGNCKQLRTVSDVYCDSLVPVIESQLKGLL